MVFFQEQFGDFQVDGGGDFQVLFFAGDQPDFGSGKFDELDVVGDLVEGNGAVLEGAEEVGAAHDLGGLHGPEFVARDGFFDARREGGGGLFDSEGDGEGGDGCAMIDGGGEGAVDERLGDEGASAIVDGDPFDSFARGFDAVPDTVRAGCAAWAEEEARIGGQERREFVESGGEDDLCDIGALQECADCVGDDGFAGEVFEEFVFWAAETSGGAGGGDDDGEIRHG